MMAKLSTVCFLHPRPLLAQLSTPTKEQVTATSTHNLHAQPPAQPPHTTSRTTSTHNLQTGLRTTHTVTIKRGVFPGKNVMREYRHKPVTKQPAEKKTSPLLLYCKPNLPYHPPINNSPNMFFFCNFSHGQSSMRQPPHRNTLTHTSWVVQSRTSISGVECVAPRPFIQQSPKTHMGKYIHKDQCG